MTLVNSKSIALLSDNEGVCIEGRWKGWLFARHPDGQWVSKRKLKLEDPLTAKVGTANLLALFGKERP